MGVSLAIHALALIFVLWLVSTRPIGGTAPTPAVRSVAMAIAHRMPERTRYITKPVEAEAESTLEPEQKNLHSDASPAPTAASPPIDLSQILAEMKGDDGPVDEGGPLDWTGRSARPGGGEGEAAAPQSLVNGRIRFPDGRSAGQLGDQELVPGVAKSGHGAGQTTTELFGVSGSGSAFVYVFDRSESMAASHSAPLRAAKTELIRSLETLTERQQFQIIFYNDTPSVFRSASDSQGLVTGEPATIARARQYVQRTTASGGTEYAPALRMALRMAPDVIFFLTDAKIQTMSEKQLDDITARAENAGTTIHAIQFGTGPAPENTFLERLVRRNGGGYRYVDVTSLK